MYTDVYVLLNKCTFATIIYNCIHVCIHLHVYTHTHKHTHIHIHTRSSLSRFVAWGSQTIVYLYVIYLHEHLSYFVWQIRLDFADVSFGDRVPSFTT